MTVLRRPAPPGWTGPSAPEELDRVQWRTGDAADPGALLADLLQAHGLGGELASARTRTSVVLLLGHAACAVLAGVDPGPPTPVPGVPDLVAVAVRETDRPAEPAPGPAAVRGPWRASWTPEEHARAVERVRESIARGEVYQANVVGHRSARCSGDPSALAARVAARGSRYAGMLTGDGWAVGSASPEQLVRVTGTRITTEPVKGTARDAEVLRASAKDRAEHVMIVDLERNDLARVAVTGSVRVESLYDLAPWADLHHASSLVAAELAPGAGVLEVLRAVAPGGSVTGAPKRAACSLLADVEPVGRGPSMGAFGTVSAGGLDLGLTIRTVAVADDRVHLWAGGGITWSSDPAAEVAEAEAKAAPVLRALSGQGED